jgi:hypothetical protein
MKKVLDEIISLDAGSSTDKSSVLQTWLGPILLYIETINEHWENRVLIATNDGKLGCASNKILQGDQACMFYGGRRLFEMYIDMEGSRFSLCKPVNRSLSLQCTSGPPEHPQTQASCAQKHTPVQHLQNGHPLYAPKNRNYVVLLQC